MKSVLTTFQFANAVNKHCPWHLKDFIRAYLLYYFWREVGIKACGVDDVYPPDSLWFGSDAVRELCCM